MKNVILIGDWNAGLWDSLHMFGEDALTPIEIYKYYIDRICIRI